MYACNLTSNVERRHSGIHILSLHVCATEKQAKIIGGAESQGACYPEQESDEKPQGAGFWGPGHISFVDLGATYTGVLCL